MNIKTVHIPDNFYFDPLECAPVLKICDQLPFLQYDLDYIYSDISDVHKSGFLNIICHPKDSATYVQTCNDELYKMIFLGI